MPTHEESPEFWKLHSSLTPERKKAFRRGVDKFIADLKRGQGFRNGLRVDRVEGAEGMWEMTWAPDGRAIFSYGDEQTPGETHIVWHAVGTHDILP